MTFLTFSFFFSSEDGKLTLLLLPLMAPSRQEIGISKFAHHLRVDCVEFYFGSSSWGTCGVEGDGWDDTSSSACEIDSSWGVEREGERGGGEEYMAARIEENEHIRGEHVFFFLVYNTTTYIHTHTHTHKCYLSVFLLLLPACHIHSFSPKGWAKPWIASSFLFQHNMYECVRDQLLD